MRGRRRNGTVCSMLGSFEALAELGYGGGDDAVRRYAMGWRRWRPALSPCGGYVPLVFAPGEACQFDWSHEQVVRAGKTAWVKAAHLRVCHSRMILVQRYPRESQERVFDAHEGAFRFFGGVCHRGIDDNMKTAVNTVFIVKEREYNERFVPMCSHQLVEPVACTPGLRGGRRGQVENEVGTARGRLFVPRPRGALVARARYLAGRAMHPRSEATSRTDDEGQDGVGGVRAGAGGPDGVPRCVRRLAFGADEGVADVAGSLRQQQLQRGGARARTPGRCVRLCRAGCHARGRRDGRGNPRRFDRGKVSYNAWHYVPVVSAEVRESDPLERARALTNGHIHPLPTAPFVIEGCGPWTKRG